MIYFFPKKKSAVKKGGFLLVELLVSIFIFSLMMTVSIGSVITLLDANRKTQSLKSVMNNLNLALDSMTKEIAVGTKYACLIDNSGNLPQVNKNCSPTSPGESGNTSGTAFHFISSDTLNNSGDPGSIIYQLSTDLDGIGYIERVDPNNFHSRMTAPEINITKLTFYVDGTAPFDDGNTPPVVDTYQPRVIIWVDGTTKAAPRGTESSFHVQTSVTQRIPDNI